MICRLCCCALQNRTIPNNTCFHTLALKVCHRRKRSTCHSKQHGSAVIQSKINLGHFSPQQIRALRDRFGGVLPEWCGISGFTNSWKIFGRNLQTQNVLKARTPRVRQEQVVRNLKRLVIGGLPNRCCRSASGLWSSLFPKLCVSQPFTVSCLLPGEMPPAVHRTSKISARKV